MITINPRLFETILLACLEKSPINLSRVDETQVRRARKAIMRAQRHRKARGLREIVTRNEFLAACLDHTSGAAAEQLIVGYGFQYARGTDIDRIHHVSGDTRSIHIPEDVRDEIRRHHSHRIDAEVLIFHNHPRTGHEPSWLYTLKAILNDLPIPSIADRQVLQSTALTRLGVLRTLLGQGQVRFYLGESDYVRAFNLPPLLQFVEQLKAIGQR